MTEISFEFLKNAIETIEELKELEFSTLDEALGYFENNLMANVYNLDKKEKLFDFTYKDIEGTISYNEELDSYMICQGTLIEIFYDENIEPILRVEV